jgi:KDO2-lipid IV(A) lauroyltransferase
MGAHWTRFLNQETAFFQGVEKISKAYDLPVVYLSIRRPSRGKFVAQYEMIADSPRSLADGEVVERFARRLEADIIAQPEIWLWTHRRWKATRPESTPLSPLSR